MTVTLCEPDDPVWRRSWWSPRRIGAAVLALGWIVVLLITVVALRWGMGPDSIRCPVPGQDSTFGDGHVTWLPLGIRCTYPADATGGVPVPDEKLTPATAVAHGLVELFLVAGPVVLACGLVRARRRSP